MPGTGTVRLLVLLLLLPLHSHRPVVLCQEVGELLVGRLLEDGFLPQVGGQIRVGGGDGGVGRLGKVAERASGPLSGGVAVVNAGHLQQLLRDGSGDDTSTARGGDEADPDRTALAGHLARHCVWLPDLVTPEAASHRDDAELSEDDRPADGGGHFLGALHAQTNVSVVISDSYKCLEPGPLSSPSLLLHRHDFQNLVLQGGSDEHIDDLVLLDGRRRQVDLLQALNLPIFDEATQLGDRDPLLVLLPASAAPTAASAISASTAPPTTAAVSKPATESSAISSTRGWSSVRHIYSAQF